MFPQGTFRLSKKGFKQLNTDTIIIQESMFPNHVNDRCFRFVCACENMDAGRVRVSGRGNKWGYQH